MRGRLFGRGRGGLLLLFESLEVEGEGDRKPKKGEVEEKNLLFPNKKKVFL